MNLKVCLLNFGCTLGVFMLSLQWVYAQSNNGDNSDNQIALNNAIKVYEESAKGQSRLFNGRQYKPYAVSFVKGSPFFNTNKCEPGSIIYDGIKYENVNLLLDELQDLLILDTGIRIEMTTERVSSFSIASHQFARLSKATTNGAITPGYYEILYAGASAVYKKDKKILKDVLNANEAVKAEVLSNVSYYIKKGNDFSPVYNINSLYTIFGDKRKELEQFINTYRLNYRKDPEVTITKVVAWYDQLIK
ncbi:hypothetical protein BH11BAC3_BH11BAC3_18130 [soil metagenome]